MGDRSEATFSRLHEGLPEAEKHRTDAYRVYRGWFPAERLVVGKSGVVNWNEGLHSVMRDKLNRLIRQIKGYSKSSSILSDSIALVEVALFRMMPQSHKRANPLSPRPYQAMSFWTRPKRPPTLVLPAPSTHFLGQFRSSPRWI